MRKRESDGYAHDPVTLRSITRLVTRFFLFPTSKLAPNCRYERRWGFQKVEQFQRYATEGWPPQVVGTYWDKGIWAE